MISRTANLAHGIYFISENAQKSISCQIRRGGRFRIATSHIVMYMDPSKTHLRVALRCVPFTHWIPLAHPAHTAGEAPPTSQLTYFSTRLMLSYHPNTDQWHMPAPSIGSKIKCCLILCIYIYNKCLQHLHSKELSRKKCVYINHIILTIIMVVNTFCAVGTV